MPRARPFETSSDCESSDNNTNKQPETAVETSTPLPRPDKNDGWRKLPDFSENSSKQTETDSNSLLKFSLDDKVQISDNSFQEIYRLAQLIVSAGAPKCMVDKSTQTAFSPTTPEIKLTDIDHEASSDERTIAELDKYLQKDNRRLHS